MEPHDLWQKRVASQYRDKAPRLRRDEDSDRIVIGDQPLLAVGMLAGCARADDEVQFEGRWEADVFRGGYDPQVRLKDLDLDSVDAEVLFPTIGMLLYPIADSELQWELFRAYNSWLAEEFCASCPERLKGIALINHEDLDVALAEIRRAKELGLVGIMLPLYPGEQNAFHDRRFDPLWATVVECGMPVNLHTATTRDPDADWQRGTPTDNVLNTFQVQHVILDMIFSGLFDRCPELKIVSAENDIGWASSMLERADYYFVRNRNIRLMEDGEIACAQQPSIYFHENVRATFMRDRGGVLAREVIGTNTMMWGSDFPHHVSTWPNSKKVLEEHFHDIPPGVRERIVCGNVRELYGL